MIIQEKKKKKNSYLYALLLQVSVVCTIIDRFVAIPNMSVIISFLLIVTIVFFNSTFVKRQLIKNIVIFFSGAFLFLLSVIRGIDLMFFEDYFLFYLVFFLTAIFANIVEIEYESVLRGLLIISAVSLLTFLLFEANEYISQTAHDYWDRQMQMTYIQCRDVMVCCAVIFSKMGKREKISALVIALVDVFFMLTYGGSRGPIVCLAIFVLVYYISNGIDNNKIIVLFFVCIGTVILLCNFYSILIFFDTLFEKCGITIGALNKTIFLLETQSNIDNGRNELYDLARDCISKNFVLGNGIGYFEENFTEGLYVHQLFYQVFCEFGIVGLVGVIVLIVKSIAFFCNKYNNFGARKMEALLFSMSILHLLFSSVYWQSSYFWMYLAWCINRFYKVRGDKNAKVTTNL